MIYYYDVLSILSWRGVLGLGVYVSTILDSTRKRVKSSALKRRSTPAHQKHNQQHHCYYYLLQETRKINTSLLLSYFLPNKEVRR